MAERTWRLPDVEPSRPSLQRILAARIGKPYRWLRLAGFGVDGRIEVVTDSEVADREVTVKGARRDVRAVRRYIPSPTYDWVVIDHMDDRHHPPDRARREPFEVTARVPPGTPVMLDLRLDHRTQVELAGEFGTMQAGTWFTDLTVRGSIEGGDLASILRNVDVARTTGHLDVWSGGSIRVGCVTASANLRADGSVTYALAEGTDPNRVEASSRIGEVHRTANVPSSVASEPAQARTRAEPIAGRRGERRTRGRRDGTRSMHRHGDGRPPR